MARGLRAFRYPFAGIRAAYGDARFRSVVWPPILFLSASMLAATWAVIAHFPDLSAVVWERPSGLGLVLWYPLQVVLAAVLAVGALFGVLVLQAIFTAPWNDALSERVERLRTGRSGPAMSFRLVWKDTLRSIRIEVGKLALYLTVMLPLFVLSLVLPGVGQVVLAVCGSVLSALLLAFDYMDWPMARRGWGFRRRLRFFGSDLWSALGFGAGCWVILFVPLLNALFVPAAVAGGTNLVLDLETELSGEAPA